MALEDYNMENERRVNSIVTEVATIRETVSTLRENERSLRESFDKLNRGQVDIQSVVNKVSATQERTESLLKYLIEAQVVAAMAPIKAELATLKEESLVRKTQIATWTMIGSGGGGIIVGFITFVLKLWGAS